MKIGLIDVDNTGYPNLPLMKLSAYHKARGDNVEWYKPLLSGHMDIVYMSKVFTFTNDFIFPIDADSIIKAGTGYAIEMINGKEVYNREKDLLLPNEIEHIYPDYSLYPDRTKDTAYGFLTRGCPRGCGFCHVARKEGRRAVKVANVSEFWRDQKNIILYDPNILAAAEHLDLLQQLSDTGARIEFNQGLDIRLITKKNLEKLRKLKMKKIHFAYDSMKDKERIESGLRAFVNETGYNRSKGGVKVFILVNFDTTLEEDLHRIQFCREINVSPYPMIYDKEHADPIYKKLQRWCNDYIFWNCKTFDEYKRK